MAEKSTIFLWMRPLISIFWQKPMETSFPKAMWIPIETPQFTEDYVPRLDMKLVIELDIFAPPFAPLIMAEVEFPDIDTANAFLTPEWFDQDVTNDPALP